MSLVAGISVSTEGANVVLLPGHTSEYTGPASCGMSDATFSYQTAETSEMSKSSVRTFSPRGISLEIRMVA